MNENQTLNQSSHPKHKMGMKTKKAIGNTVGHISLVLIAIL